MSREKEEQTWILAGENGDSATLKNLIAKKTTKPDAPKVCESLVCASGKGHIQAMRVLLEFGASPDSKDQVGRPALHSACENGAPAGIRVLCEYGVDFSVVDYSGCTAFSLAIKGKQMPCCKELLRGGAPLPSGESAAGLAAILREVQLERLQTELVAARDTPEVTNEEVNAADPRAWACQREHMRLLRIKEEQRAGNALTNFDARTELEEECAARSVLEEQKTQNLVKEKRVELQTLRGNLVLLNRDANSELNVENLLDAEDAQLRAEIQQRMEELSTAESAAEATRQLQPGEQERIDKGTDRWTRLEEEIAEQRQFNEMETEELEEAQREFERWKRDREAAFQLTAQAHKLLGN